MMNAEQYLEAGKITNTHGIRGEVRVQPWGDGPEFLCEFDEIYVDGKPMQVKASRIHKGFVLMQLEGVNSIEEAELLKNKIVYIDRDEVELPEGTHFVADLIGMTVVNDETGEELGTLKDVLDYPTQDIFVIKGAHEYMIPAVDEFLKEIDDENRVIRMKVLEGMAIDEN